MGELAFREGAICYEQALAALQHLPDDSTKMEQGIDLRLEMRNVIYPLGDFDRVWSILGEAERLAEALGEPRRLGRVSAHVVERCVQTGEHERGITTGERVLSLARTLGDFALELEANVGLGYLYWLSGSYHQAIAASEWMMTSLTGEQNHNRFSLVYLPAVICRQILTSCLAEQGAFAEGIAYGEEGLSIAEVVNRPHDITFITRGLGYLHLLRGELDTAISILERGLAICETAEISHLARAFRNFLGYTYALAGRHDDALPLLEHSVDEMASTSTGVPDPARRMTWLGEAYLLAGRVQDATPLAIHALKLAQARQDRRGQVWALRLSGEIAVHRDPPEFELAETHYQQALALANELGMRPLQAHCHRGLGTLYSQTGQSEQARAELSTAIEMYRDMEMTFWLPGTEAALIDVESR